MDVQQLRGEKERICSAFTEDWVELGDFRTVLSFSASDLFSIKSASIKPLAIFTESNISAVFRRWAPKRYWTGKIFKRAISPLCSASKILHSVMKPSAILKEKAIRKISVHYTFPPAPSKPANARLPIFFQRLHQRAERRKRENKYT